jgi:hypothetical protein
MNFGKLSVSDIYGNLHEERSGIREFQVSGSGHYSISPGEFSVGLTLKYLQFYFPLMDCGSLLVDMGMRFRVKHPKKWYSFGISISNLGNELKHYGDVLDLDHPIHLLRCGIAAGCVASSDSGIGLMYTIEYQSSLNNNDLWAE